MAHNPAARYLPPGFPLPEGEAIAALRASILQQVRTPHPPDTAELALLIASDEAGIDLSEVEAAEVWRSPATDREPLFEALARVLAQVAEG